ncbi:MAG: bacteriochlorophyll 4-vinyl reductase [Pseudomonadota bacterium]
MNRRAEMQCGGARAANDNEALAARRLIGPNALTQVADALIARHGSAMASRTFLRAGLGHRLERRPSDMIPAGEAADLNRALFELLGEEEAHGVVRQAGASLADYLLARRIPAAAQRVFRNAPRAFGRALLYAAIAKNAQTFAGGGRFAWRRVDGADHLTIEDSALTLGFTDAPVPVCGLFAATFEGLLRSLIDPRVRVRETRCRAMGGAASTEPLLFLAERV